MKSPTLTIGRRPDSDIRIRDETVSRRHAELTVTSNGRYYVTDCGSLRGTRVLRGGEWIPLRQGYVDPDERLRFGEFETKLAHLLEGNAHEVKARRSRAVAASARRRRSLDSSEVEDGPVNAK